MIEPSALLEIEAELPSGRTVKLREPRGSDELAAAGDGSEEPREEAKAILGTWALMMRCTVEIDGKPVDQSTLTPQSYRDLFNTRDYVLLRDLWYSTFYDVTKEDKAKFESSKRGSAAS